MNSSMIKPIQIVVCGKSPQVIRGVTEGIKPTYEALHVINSVEDGVRDLPALLDEKPSSKEKANAGSQKYGNRVAAVVAGGGYSEADFSQLRQACQAKSTVPWLRHDISADIDPSKPRPKIDVAYGEQTASKIVRCLNDLKENGKMDKDGVYWF